MDKKGRENVRGFKKNVFFLFFFIETNTLYIIGCLSMVFRELIFDG